MIKNLIKNMFNSKEEIELDVDKVINYYNNKDSNDDDIDDDIDDDEFISRFSKKDDNENDNDILSQFSDYNHKIDKNYIKRKYDADLLYPLMGQRDKNQDVYSFYINKYDAKDIKLPFELLSPIKTLESDRHNAVFELDVKENYEQFFIYTPYYNVGYTDLAFGVNRYNMWFNDEDYRYFRGIKDRGMDAQFTYHYHVDKGRLKGHARSAKAIIELVDTYNLTSQSIVDYYVRLIKQHQPSIDEMYEILIKFEKSKQEINRLNVINQEKILNKALNDLSLIHI